MALLTEINRLNTKTPKTLRTSLLTVRARAINLEGTCATRNEPELGRKEDLIALPSALEPFP